MITITIDSAEAFDEEKEEFVKLDAVKLELEHSLVSLSKWESIWEKPFLGPVKKTTEETFSYIESMNQTPDIPSDVFLRLTPKNLTDINHYIDAKMTATWFNEAAAPPPLVQETITAELVYYWMIALNIPFECQHWHLNRLLTLVKVCNEKNQPEKTLSAQEVAARNKALNAQRKAQLKTSG